MRKARLRPRVPRRAVLARTRERGSTIAWFTSFSGETSQAMVAPLSRPGAAQDRGEECQPPGHAVQPVGEKGIPKDSEAGRQQFTSLMERGRAEEPGRVCPAPGGRAWEKLKSHPEATPRPSGSQPVATRKPP
jgi:hypothetical protein